MSPKIPQKSLLLAIAMACLAIASLPASAELSITEFLARSSSDSLRDEDGVPSDWLEIHNSGSNPVSTAGYFLTDNAEILTKWELPDVTIPAGGYLVVFCSSKDRAVAGSELHTNFNLSGGGEYLALVDPDGVTVITAFQPEFPEQYENISYGFGALGAPTRETFVARDGGGTFLIPLDGSLGDTWRNPPGSGAGEFDDSSWTPFTGGIGFESAGGTLEPLITTNITDEMKGVNASGYFRYAFDFDATDRQVSTVLLNIQVDDGFVAYLNGQEIGNLKAPSPIQWDSRALTSPSRSDSDVVEEILAYDASTQAGALRDGMNVLAIQGMNTSPSGSDFALLPELIADVLDTSAGLQLGFMSEPTPGAPNNSVVNGPPARVVFSESSKAFTDTFNLSLSVATPGANIRYTLDGTIPTDDIQNPSPLYAGPLVINDTTQVRAAAFLTGSLPAESRTEGFFKLSPDAAAFTSDLPIVLIDSFGGGAPFAADQTPRRPMMLALWEPKGEVDPRSSMMNPPDLVTRIGARKRGSSSRNWPKYNMSIEGWTEDDWDENSFEPLGMPGDDDWVLSSRYQFDRALMRNTLVYRLSRDIGRHAARTRYIELFNNTNGGEIQFSEARGAEYFGVYEFMEKLDRGADRIDVERLDESIDSEPEITGGYIFKNDRGSPTFPVSWGNGGSDSLVWVYPDGGTDPNRPNDYVVTTAQRNWLIGHMNEIGVAVSAANGINPSTGIHFTEYIDVPSFIDHMWLNALMMNVDWGRLSGWMYKPRNAPLVGGPIWDFDRSAGSEDNRDNNALGWNPSGDSRVWYDGQYPWYGKVLGFHSNTDNPSSQLSTRPDQFQQAVDRWFELRQEGQAFSDAHIAGRVDEFADTISEAAPRNFTKWTAVSPNGGQYSGGVSGWEGEVVHLKGWLAARTNWIDQQFFQPPTLNQDGGVVAAGFELTMNSNEATVYYTLDGSDPRAPGGGIAAGAIPFDGGPVDTVALPDDSNCNYLIPADDSLEASWFQPGFNDASWAIGTSGLGFETATGALNAEIVTDITDEMKGVNASGYFRYEFDFDNAANINSMVLEVKYDDGFVAYLNGTEVARSSSAPATLSWDARSSSGPPDSTVVSYTFNGAADNSTFDFDLTAFRGSVINGTNVLAIQGMNSSSSGSDFLIKPRLNINHTVVASPITLSESASVVARAHDGQEWSSPTRANFVVGADLADATNLVISEIMYNPIGATAAELAAGFTDGDQFEYLELLNISANPVSLLDVRFTAGISYDFAAAEVTMLEPGERVLVVRDQAAFGERYGNAFDSIIAGVFANGTALANGGERLALAGANGVIRDFTYNDRYPWPESSDGSGPSMVLISPQGNPDHGVATNWRASVGALGSVGGGDSTTFSGDPDADGDGDGITAFAEYAFGTSDSDAAGGSILRANLDASGALAITFPVNLAADDAQISVEISTALTSWLPAGDMLDLATEVHNGDGTATFTYEMTAPMEPGADLFVRLKVTSR